MQSIRCWSEKKTSLHLDIYGTHCYNLRDIGSSDKSLENALTCILMHRSGFILYVYTVSCRMIFPKFLISGVNNRIIYITKKCIDRKFEHKFGREMSAVTRYCWPSYVLRAHHSIKTVILLYNFTYSWCICYNNRVKQAV